MIAWLIGGAVAALVVGFLVSRVRANGRIFSDAHFLEVAGAAAGVKAAALAKTLKAPGDEPTTREDPRLHVTTAGLAIAYTVREQTGSFVHHCSVSVAGGYTAHAVGRTFVACFAQLVGLPIDKMGFEIGESTVHHGEVTLSEAEHQALAAAPVTRVSAENVAEVRRAAFDAGARVSWRRSLPPH